MTTGEQEAIGLLLAQGLTATEMAKQLGMKVRTVHWKLQLLYAMYGIPAGKNRNIKLLAALGYINEKARPSSL